VGELTASVIVPSHNGRHHLDTCLDSVMSQQVEGGFEVLLVDNGSRDGTAKHVRNRHRDVCVIEMGRNLGFSAGCNVGLAHARGRYPVLLDNDTCVRPGWLEALVEAAEAEPRAGAVCSKLILMGRPAVLNAAGLLLFDDGFGVCRGWLEEDRGQYEQREEVFAGPGNGLLLRREALAEVGTLDDIFFAYYDDADLCWRMRLRGWTVIYEPRAVVEHRHSGASTSPAFVFYTNRNRIFMTLKNGSPRRAWGVVTDGAWMNAAVGIWQLPIKLSVAASVAAHLPEMLLKRVRSRRGRRVMDAQIDLWRSSQAHWYERFLRVRALEI
jgi:GT2 family glycosyltransferase